MNVKQLVDELTERMIPFISERVGDTDVEIYESIAPILRAVVEKHTQSPVLGLRIRIVEAVMKALVMLDRDQDFIDFGNYDSDSVKKELHRVVEKELGDR